MESINLTRELVGRRYPRRRNYLHRTWVREFLQVVDSESEFEGGEVPNTFTPALRDGPFEVFEDLKVELKRLLHVSQEYDHRRPMLAEKWIESETEISDLKEKSSKLGGIYIMDLRTTFTQENEVVFSSVMRVFIRK